MSTASSSRAPVARISYPPPASDGSPDLGHDRLYLNRELSWLEFNARVLAEGGSELVPPLERLKFHAIVASNLDEFFMVRVAGLKQQLSGEIGESGPDGMTPSDQLAAISKRVHAMVAEQDRLLEEDLLPVLERLGIVLVKPEKLLPSTLGELDERFQEEIFPILTPMAIDMGHPFPHVRNKSINLGVMFQREGTHAAGFGVVQVPMVLPRLLEVSGTQTARTFVLLEDLIARHVGSIFPGVPIAGVYVFRVTRNFDLEIDEEDAHDLLQTIQQELRRRERGAAVRLEIAGDPTASSVAKLVKALKLDAERDVYRMRTLLQVSDLVHLASADARRELRDEPAAPQAVPLLRDSDDVFATLRDTDVLLHHPYESFDHVVDLLTRAAEDPAVLAIKQTLYRPGVDSPFVKALARAAEAGKQVTALVELKARFDEESNILWARTLEQSGVNVVYGLLGLKTHAKCLLILRREGSGLRRYVHLGTGNYNTTTARTYTDYSLLTARREIGEDASSLFNLLTGYAAPARWNSFIVAPIALHDSVLGLIAREAENAKAGRPSGITAKMNALVDGDVIEALYAASRAGVPITLLVRGVCCLRPGVPGISDTIVVHAIIDRYLEHGRVAHFVNGGEDEVYISSADWMPRNFRRRVELMVPVETAALKQRLIGILQTSTSDTVKSWTLRLDGSYVRAQDARTSVSQITTPPPPVRSQERFIEAARERIKVDNGAPHPSGRFHTASPAARSSLDGKVPRERARRKR